MIAFEGIGGGLGSHNVLVAGGGLVGPQFSPVGETRSGVLQRLELRLERAERLFSRLVRLLPIGEHVELTPLDGHELADQRTGVDPGGKPG
jgi:hypothetical protein